ncbi:MAG: hypothetical protein AAF533_14320 [Acidobacteriota bacterium]
MRTTARRTLTLLLGLVVSTAALAQEDPVIGDLHPRDEPDAAITLGDALIALQVARELADPATPEELAISDVFPGDLSSPLANPPVHTPSSDGALSDADARLILRSALGLVELGQPRVLTLLNQSSTVFSSDLDGEYENTALLSTPLANPASFGLVEPPMGMTVDPVTGKLDFTPMPGQEGVLQFEVVATDGASQVSGKFQVNVVTGEIEAVSEFTTAGGGEVEVTDEESPIVGSKFSAPPGVPPDDEMLSLSTVPEGTFPEWGEGAMSMGETILPPQGKSFDGETTVTVAYEDEDIPEGCTEDDLMVAHYQQGKFGDNEDGLLRPSWVLLDGEIDTLNNRVTGRLTGEIDGPIRVFAMPPQVCAVDNTGQDIQVVIRNCPNYDPELARTYTQVALDTFTGLGFDVPNQLTVVIEETEPGLLGYAHPASPTVLHLSNDLNDGDLKTTSAHELFHLIQFNEMGPARMNHFSFANNLYIMEGAAAYSEELVWDDVNAYLTKGNRVAPIVPQAPIDFQPFRYAQFTFFNFLDTYYKNVLEQPGGFPLVELYQADPPTLYAAPGGGATIIDDILGDLEFGCEPDFLDFPPVFTEPAIVDAHANYVFAHCIRDESLIDEIDTWGFPPPPLQQVPLEARAETPHELLPLSAVPHLSGQSILLDLPPSSLDFVIRMRASEVLRAEIWFENPFLNQWECITNVNAPAIEFFASGFVGLFKIVITNPSIVPSDVAGVLVDAWYGCPLDIEVISPVNGGETTGETVLLEGIATVAPIDENSSTCAQAGDFVNEVKIDTPTGEVIADLMETGEFSAEVPVLPGVNTYSIFALTDCGCSSTIGHVVQRVREDTKLVARLSWDLEDADLNLYVTQPDGQEVFFGNSEDSLGEGVLEGSLISGDGPEIYTFASPVMPSGTFDFDIHYFDDNLGPPDREVSWTLEIIENPGMENEFRSSVMGTIGVSNSSNINPGSEGPDWIPEPVVHPFGGR